MGSPLAPVLANIFMGFYESKWLNEYSLHKPKFYLRYADDILAAFDKEQDLLNFLNFLNKRHPNIKFMIEKQINNSIAFLDVFTSSINNQNLTLQTCHKSTYMGLLFNFKSFTSFSYEISLIKCLIDRSLSASFTVLITLRYYLISLQHFFYHTLFFHLLFHDLFANCWHLLLS